MRESPVGLALAGLFFVRGGRVATRGFLTYKALRCRDAIGAGGLNQQKRITMADTLLSFFPTPDALLRAEVEELAPMVLVVAPGVMQNGIFEIASLVAPLYPLTGGGYPGASQVEVRRAIAEALSFLERDGTIIKDPDQPATWYRLTRRQGPADLETAREWVAQRAAGQQSGTRWAPRPGGSNELRGRQAPSLHPVGPTSSPTPLIVNPQEQPPPVRATMMAGTGEFRAEGTGEVTGQGISVQSYLVTTPLAFQGASLISLTLRFLDPTIHNQLPNILATTLAEDFEGWEREPVRTGAALLDRLAMVGSGVNQALRDAIIEALDHHAAALQFSDPHSFRYPDLAKLAHGIDTLAKLPARNFRVGLFRATTTLILIGLAVAIPLAVATVLVTELGSVITTRAGQHVNTTGRAPP